MDIVLDLLATIITVGLVIIGIFIFRILLAVASTSKRRDVKRLTLVVVVIYGGILAGRAGWSGWSIRDIVHDSLLRW